MSFQLREENIDIFTESNLHFSITSFMLSTVLEKFEVQ